MNKRPAAMGPSRVRSVLGTAVQWRKPWYFSSVTYAAAYNRTINYPPRAVARPVNSRLTRGNR